MSGENKNERTINQAKVSILASVAIVWFHKTGLHKQRFCFSSEMAAVEYKNSISWIKSLMQHYSASAHKILIAPEIVAHIRIMYMILWERCCCCKITISSSDNGTLCVVRVYFQRITIVCIFFEAHISTDYVH